MSQKKAAVRKTCGVNFLSSETANDLKWFLTICSFFMQGGKVIDKVMMIKDVHGPEAWLPKEMKN